MAGKRKVYAPEFKLAAVKMITEQKLSVAEVARRLGVTENRLHDWKKAVLKIGGRRVPRVGPPDPRRGRAATPPGRRQASGDGAGHPKKSHGVLRHPDELTFAWIEERRADWPVAVLCRVLDVSRSGYYAWRGREPSPTDARRHELTDQVAEIHAQVKGRYGSPRMHAELVDRGHACCENTVARVMREAGIAAKTTRKFRQTTDSNHPHPVAENILDREFDPDEPNASWVADVTYIPTREGWLYLAAVVDLFSRMVVGWSMAATMTSRLVVDALEMAVVRRPEGSSEWVAHSDRGSQYASEHDQRRLEEERIVCSMSRRGNCWDNAPMESFFASLKKELVHHEDYPTRAQATASIFEYIEAFYNRVRRHSSLGYVAPAEFERTHNQTHR